MVEQKLPKLKTRVRFPSPAPITQWPSASGNQFRCVEKATQRLNSLQVVLQKTALGRNDYGGLGFKSGCFAFPDDIGYPDITTDRQRRADSQHDPSGHTPVSSPRVGCQGGVFCGVVLPPRGEPLIRSGNFLCPVSGQIARVDTAARIVLPEFADMRASVEAFFKAVHFLLRQPFHLSQRNRPSRIAASNNWPICCAPSSAFS